MNVNNENKLQELSLYVNINLNNMNIQKQQNAKTYNKDNNSLNNINKIKRKVNIMNYNQRELQSRISDIQIQEAKIEEMEKTLQDAKNIYSENIKNEKKESLNIKVKIKQLAKKEDELNFKSYEEINSKNTDNKLEDERTISIIEETLKKIEQVKNKISIYKTKLMILEDSVDKAVSKLYSNKDSIHKDFINEELGFISIENNIETGILINIAI
ncbi:hypothetical protein [uncultured Clostridium sp.]|uniref:hypothetical protein n=1 Tax=uncultured Clostridium sp. TaxID=59620 RepID=UPI0025F5FAC1|nr:hypothetical protein [uncultured Clostridium sp.]